ncbi:MAG: hypothetical protein WC870_02120 [Candidatus Paceibacterota bacterium]
MMEGKNINEIEEKTEAEYREMVEERKRLMPKITKLAFSPNMLVAVSMGEAHLEGIVRKGEAGVYIVDVKNTDGTVTPVISTESEIDFWN